MVSETLPLSLGAFVGILMSGGFVWLEVGRYATPQVPVSLFDERRTLFAYTAGLFVGIPLAVVFVLFVDSMDNGALPGGLLFLALLIVSTELAQYLLLRSRYWGRGESAPFYALTFRASIAGLMVLGLMSQYLSIASPITWDGLALLLTRGFAVLMLEVAGALLSLKPTPYSGRTSGGPFPGGGFEAIGFFLMGLGALSGEIGSFLGAGLALIGGLLVYQRLRPILATVSPPEAGPPLPRTGPAPSFGRLEGSEPKK